MILLCNNPSLVSGPFAIVSASLVSVPEEACSENGCNLLPGVWALPEYHLFSLTFTIKRNTSKIYNMTIKQKIDYRIRRILYDGTVFDDYSAAFYILGTLAFAKTVEKSDKCEEKHGRMKAYEKEGYNSSLPCAGIYIDWLWK